MIIVLMGVSGSGKSTIGKDLAEQLGWTFVEGDEFHRQANVLKMHAGIPLTDDDRKPWLSTLRKRIEDSCTSGECIVLACSALKHDYRWYLEDHDPFRVIYVYLSGSKHVIGERLAARKGHFMDPGLLQIQFETLEAPDFQEVAIQVDVAAAPEAITAEIRRRLAI